MKKISVLSALCTLALAQIVSASSYNEVGAERIGIAAPTTIVSPSGQPHTQHISFDDGVGPGNAGTYNSTDTFGLDIFLTWQGYNDYGLSLWLQTNAAPHILLTGFTYGTTFEDPTQPFIKYPLGFSVLQPNFLYTTPNPSDLGSTPLDPHAGGVAPGTALVGHLSVSLTGLDPGTYVLQSDATGPHTSVASSFDGVTFHDEAIPVATYTITIVPEPGTLALLIVGAVAASAGTWRRTHAKKTANPTRTLHTPRS
jgi:hypothetical protein